MILLLHLISLKTFHQGCYLKDKGGEGSKLLEETGSDRLKVVQLDVTDEQSVLNTAEFIKSNLPPGEKGE